jgi:hypothetical protein
LLDVQVGVSYSKQYDLKVKLTLVQAMKAEKGSRCIALLFL